MSAAFVEATSALSQDPELRNRVMAANTAAERAEILRAAGVPVPTHAEVNASLLAMSDVQGAGKNPGWTKDDTNDLIDGIDTASTVASAGAAA